MAQKDSREVVFEVQFYLDRTRESALRIGQAIANNPTLSASERSHYLQEIGKQHSWLGSILLGNHTPDPLEVEEVFVDTVKRPKKVR